jgi:hypothetical protein
MILSDLVVNLSSPSNDPLNLVLVHFTETSFDRFFDRMPFDREVNWPNAIWPNAIWPNAISPKFHLTDFFLAKGQTTEFTFD